MAWFRQATNKLSLIQVVARPKWVKDIEVPTESVSLIRIKQTENVLHLGITCNLGQGESDQSSQMLNPVSRILKMLPI